MFSCKFLQMRCDSAAVFLFVDSKTFEIIILINSGRDSFTACDLFEWIDPNANQFKSEWRVIIFVWKSAMEKKNWIEREKEVNK